MDILTYALFLFIYFILLALSTKIPIFGAINIPITLFIMVLAWNGITYDVIINNSITTRQIMTQQELALLTSLQVIIQALIVIFKLKM
jgi:hypothetical protein